jgi:hypothetical protein
LSNRPDPASLEAARRYFSAARTSRPELANALARMAELELLSRAGPSVETRAAIERARALAPGRPEYAMIHAQILAQQEDFTAARAVLEPLLSNQYSADVRDGARSLLAQIVDVETRRLVRSGGLPATPATTAPVGNATPEFPTRPAGPPAFRELQAGEQRLEAVLERIECDGGKAVFHVNTTTGPTTFTAARLGDVDFITYRADLTGSVECGTSKRPMPVYVTWRSGSDASRGRIVVAIEFLQKDPG